MPPASASRTEAGEGVRAVVEGREVFVGTMAWVAAQLDCQPITARPDDSSISTQVCVGWAGVGIAGTLTFTDALREDAQHVVRSLQQAGKRVILLSGDMQGVVEAAAADVGIAAADAHGHVRPAEKAAFVSRLRAEGACVAMVGDGVNDAVALSAADVGVAMGGGTDAAGEAAAVVLMGDRLGQLPEALNLGTATLNKIKQNLALAVAYNVIGIPVAAGALLPTHGILLSPTIAAGMMACSSIAVVTNSLLLRNTLEKRA
jgi:Cu2+-exporting ATPase